MGLLASFFIDEGTGTPSYAGGFDVPNENKCEMRNITPLQTAQMLAILRDIDYSVSLIKEFPCLTNDEEEWTMSIPDDMTVSLSKLDTEQIDSFALQLSEATAAELGWSKSDFVPVVTELSALSKRAIEQNKKMFFWNSL